MLLATRLNLGQVHRDRIIYQYLLQSRILTHHLLNTKVPINRLFTWLGVRLIEFDFFETYLLWFAPDHTSEALLHI